MIARTLGLASLVACGLLLTAGCARQAPEGHPQFTPATTDASIAPVSIPGVESCHDLADLQRPSAPAPRGALHPLALPCLTSGPRVNLALLRGKPLLVNLWASWCGPCRKEMPILQTISAQHRQAVQFVGIDTRDDSRAAATFLADVGVTYPQLADPSARLAKQLRIIGLPVTFLIRPDGVVTRKHVGPISREQLEDLLK